MAGLIIAPREEDFNRLTAEEAVGILREVAIDDVEAKEIVRKLKAQTLANSTHHSYKEEPDVAVGIFSSQSVFLQISRISLMVFWDWDGMAMMIWSI